MSKMLINVFTFNAAKEFLSIMEHKVFDSTLENNIFSHSSNPLLTMSLMFEMLGEITKKFYSLNNQCKNLMRQIMEMMLEYIESVDDENFLTAILLEKDYSGRDPLRIAIELEQLELIQAPKVESTIKRIYNSDYRQLGTLFEMSTPY